MTVPLTSVSTGAQSALTLPALDSRVRTAPGSAFPTPNEKLSTKCAPFILPLRLGHRHCRSYMAGSVGFTPAALLMRARSWTIHLVPPAHDTTGQGADHACMRDRVSHACPRVCGYSATSVDTEMHTSHALSCNACTQSCGHMQCALLAALPLRNSRNSPACMHGLALQVWQAWCQEAATAIPCICMGPCYASFPNCQEWAACQENGGRHSKAFPETSDPPPPHLLWQVKKAF